VRCDSNPRCATLEAHLRRSGSLSLPLAKEVVTQVAKALVAAKVHGLVHRDLKSANLTLVGPELTVKVIDFGDLARETCVRVRRAVHSDYRFGDA
jgi:serine/threonine protein kinase